MSVNILDIKCDKCNFRSSSNRLWGRYVYELPDGEWLTIPRSAGWCYDCQNIQPVETLSIEELKIKDHGNNNLQKERSIKEYGTIKSILSLFGFYRSPMKKELKDVVPDVDILRRKFSSLRQDPAKCLICGQVNVTVIKLISEREGPLALSHPNCGGKLYVRESNTSFHCKFASRVYDIQGNYIRTENDWE